MTQFGVLIGITPILWISLKARRRPGKVRRAWPLDGRTAAEARIAEDRSEFS